MNLIKILFITIIFGTSSLNAQEISDFWPKGKIKFVKISVYENNFEIEKQPLFTTEAKFNKERQITELTEIDFFDDWYHKQDWIRNNSDSTITSNEYEKNGEIIFKSVFHIDGKGHYKYKISYNLDDRTEEKSYYTYNEFGKRSKILYYDKRENLYGETIFEYDENQNMINYKYTNSYNSVRNNQIKYKFDNKNNLIVKEQYGPSKALEIIDYFTYDENNLLIEKTILRSKKDKIETVFYKYISFDDFGNWTKRLIFDIKLKKGVPKRTETREIVYY